MTNLKDQPAFPRNYAYMNPEAGKSELRSESGLTIRQEFAKAAMQGLCASPTFKFPKDKSAEFYYAQVAVIFADALIAELEKGK